MKRWLRPRRAMIFREKKFAVKRYGKYAKNELICDNSTKWKRKDKFSLKDIDAGRKKGYHNGHEYVMR